MGKELQKVLVRIAMMVFLICFTRIVFATNQHQSISEQFLERARLEASKGDFETAIALYRKVLHLDEENALARKEYRTVLIKAQISDPYSDEGIERLWAAEAHNPKLAFLPTEFPLGFLENASLYFKESHINYEILLALTQTHRGQSLEAQHTLSRLLQEYPNHPVVYNLLGLAAKAEALRTGSDATKLLAKQHFQKAVELNSNFKAARINLAELEIESGDLINAEQDLKIVLQSDQNNRQANLLMAQIAKIKGDSDKEKYWHNRAMERL